jgi:hypothetical protein
MKGDFYMKKKSIALFLVSIMALTPLQVFADEKDDRIAELEAQIEEMQITIDDLTAQLEELQAGSKSTDQDAYQIGDTWIVENQWKLTVDSVEETEERNEFADQDPAAVYIVSYTYENLGYEADGWNGLFLSIDDGIVDSAGTMGYSYPGDVTDYPQETPVGATCKAQVCIGVDHAGSFEIHFSTYDGNDKEQKAVFSIEMNE